MKHNIEYYALVGCHGNDNNIYIGQTIIGFENRLKGHKSKQYTDAYVIDTSISTDRESLDIENAWMDYYHGLGWNVISNKRHSIVRKRNPESIHKGVTKMVEIRRFNNSYKTGATKMIATRISNGTDRGWSQSEETREKIRLAQYNKPKHPCPYCNVLFANNHMKRHMNKCKQKGTN
jgi:hypothetical protein